MSYENAASIALSFAFIVIVTSEVVLVIMIIKTKRVKEQETPDRKRHADIIFASVTCVDVLGSCLIYPTLIRVQNQTNVDICTTLGAAAAFYMSCIAVLTVFINIHGFYSSVRPFHYFIYLRRKNSRIPFACVAFSLCIGLVSLVLNACGYSFFRLKPGFYFSLPACIPELQENTVVYYYIVIIQLAFLVNFIALIHAFFDLTKRKRWRSQSITGGNTDCCGFPEGANFKLTYKLMYLFTWSPLTVVMTMLVSRYHVSSDVILTCCYLMLVPGPLSSCVFYLTSIDFREVFNESLKTLYRKITFARHGNARREQRMANQQEIELEER